jgi:hypothetical protein
VDNWSAGIRLTQCYYRRSYQSQPAGDGRVRPAGKRIADHVDYLNREVAAFGKICADLAAGHPEREQLLRRQHLMITLNRIANELLTMAVVLARSDNNGDRADLADIYCRPARRRVALLQMELVDIPDQDHASIVANWLSGNAYGSLLDNVITEPPMPHQEDV